MSILNKKDLESVNKEVLLFNLTSSTEFLDSSQIIFSEFYDQGIKLILPQKICAYGHSLLVAICHAGLAKNISEFLPSTDASWADFVGIGKVINLEDQSAETTAIEIKLTQYEAKDWNALISNLRQAQKDVDITLSKMKG